MSVELQALVVWLILCFASGIEHWRFTKLVIAYERARPDPEFRMKRLSPPTDLIFMPMFILGGAIAAAITSAACGFVIQHFGAERFDPTEWLNWSAITAAGFWILFMVMAPSILHSMVKK